MVAETSNPVVRLERPRDGVALVTLNRPQARNSLTLDTWSALESTLKGLYDESELHCVVLTGAGGYFSAGGDLKSTPAAGFRANAAVGRLQVAQRTIQYMSSFPVPLIAAVEGGAAGLGWSLALAYDTIFTSAEAHFIAPFVARGVTPDGGAGWHLVRRIGRHCAADILFTGRPVTGNEARQLGLANAIAEAGAVVAAAVAYGASLPTASPHALELTKQLLASADGLDLTNYLKLELAIATQCQQGPESDTARRDFQGRAGKRSRGK
jgi:enoyl-CoA hydratase/carnithine racemase